MLKTFLLYFAIHSFAMAASDSFSCSDGTFGNNGIGITETENRYEVLMHGSQLGPLSFDLGGDTYGIGEWHNAITLLMPFNKNECTIADQRNVQCQKELANPAQSLYLRRYVNDLDNFIEALSPIPVRKLNFKFQNGIATLEIVDGYFELRSQTVTLGPLDCTTPNLIDKEFPQRIRDYLDARLMGPNHGAVSI